MGVGRRVGHVFTIAPFPIAPRPRPHRLNVLGSAARQSVLEPALVARHLARGAPSRGKLFRPSFFPLDASDNEICSSLNRRESGRFAGRAQPTAAEQPRPTRRALARPISSRPFLLTASTLPWLTLQLHPPFILFTTLNLISAARPMRGLEDGTRGNTAPKHPSGASLVESSSQRVGASGAVTPGGRARFLQAYGRHSQPDALCPRSVFQRGSSTDEPRPRP